ncbi:tetratricopeptide repeat protein [Celeribacter ethanolicus]|uniref:tetratricopeptide repeat protein n=1 Tax=Celeribacter ethanolicus TaxID=1758178 RepID=UPI00082AAC18|nr:SEL1-like repeat protein [Celeribacter ethanolicus]
MLHSGLRKIARWGTLWGTVSLACLALPLAGGAQDLDAPALKAAAEAGDMVAARQLGSALLWGYGGVDQDVEAATLLLTHAAEAGDAKAQSTLGQAYLWGTPLAKDLAEADRLLSAAAALGDASAMRVLGQQLIGGWVMPQDIERGLPLLEGAAAQGDVPAKIALGEFYLYGKPLAKDWTRAEALFEEAAAAGDGSGLAAYGAMLMWSEKDWRTAEADLIRAGEMGEGGAWVTLAEGAMYGYLGADSRGKFDGFADKARAAGEERIAVLESQRATWGISMEASGPKALAELETAAEDGNVTALLNLISLQRDGNRYNIRKDPAGALASLEAHGDLLSAEQRTQYALTIAAATHRMKQDLPKMAARIEAAVAETPGLMTDWFGKELYKANPNLAIYMLQADLKAQGLYGGAQDGYAGPRTLKGLYKMCKALPGEENCGDRVLDAGLIGKLLAR